MNNFTIWSSFATILNFLILFAIGVGGYVTVRSSMSKAATDIQRQVREALQDENNMLHNRITRLEAENKQLNQTILFIINALKRTYHLEVKIEGNIITIHDATGAKTTLLQDVDQSEAAS